MNCCYETTKMDVPARHRERSGEARAGHLATAECWFRGVPQWYVAGADT
jgi:hypothetical protein